MGIIDALKEVKMSELHVIGIASGRSRGTYSPCPFCMATQRGSADARGPIGTSSEAGGMCHACDERFDTADLICQRLMGKRFRELNAEGRKAFETACLRHGWKSNSSYSSHKSNEKMIPVSKMVEAILAKTEPKKKKVAEKPPEPEVIDESKPLPLGDFPWDPRYVDVWHDALYTEAGTNALNYLKDVRGFNDETIKKWKIGYYTMVRGDKVYEEFISIPMLNEHMRPVNFRFRSVPGKCKYCDGKGCKQCKDSGEVRKKYRPCTGRPLVLFGAHTLSADSDTSVLVLEGELDVIAASQYGYDTNVVSSTAGATTFKDEWLDLIEPYRSFTLALDDDEAGNTGADALAEKLGRYRCARALFPENDIGACLEKGLEESVVKRAVDRAKSMLKSDFKTADAFVDELELLISEPDKLKGMTTGSAKLDAMMGGWRPGLAIVTADTGSGKTTFMTWAMYQQAIRGIPTAITSFENRPISAVQKLLRQHIGGDFSALSKGQRRDALTEIGEMPLYILDHAGHMKFSDVVETVRYSVRRHGTRMILIDHLGFLISSEAEDERREIEAVVRALALLAYNEGITICLIAHPNNNSVNQRRRVQMHDLKGASAIRQDASIVMVIERGQPNRETPYNNSKVHLDKCRSEFGLAGQSVTLAFSPEAVTYADDPAELPTK